MLSLSIKISDLAIYDIIYISKLVFWFVLCIPVCGFIETLGQPNTLDVLQLWKYPPYRVSGQPRVIQSYW